MSMLVEGKWRVDTQFANEDGEFVRQPTTCRDSVAPAVDAEHPAVAGRYHLYVSYACPWAHRVLITRALKGLEDAISFTPVDPLMGDEGWVFSDRLGCHPDPIMGAQDLKTVYREHDPEFTGKVTVPVLWDKQAKKIVNNESRDLVAMLDRAFSPVAERSELALWPEERDGEIGDMIDANYEPINNGVYRSGFATSQVAYEKAVGELFARLDWCEERLQAQPFLCGDRATAADICLFTTLLRFEPVYHYHFKCNLRRLRDYDALWDFTRALFQVPEVRKTCNLDHIKLHYFQSHPDVNPSGVVPVGPELDLEAPVSAARRDPFGLGG